MEEQTTDDLTIRLELLLCLLSDAHLVIERRVDELVAQLEEVEEAPERGFEFMRSTERHAEAIGERNRAVGKYVKEATLIAEHLRRRAIAELRREW